MPATNLLTGRTNWRVTRCVHSERIKQPMDMKAFVKRVRLLHQGMPVTEPVVDKFRRTSRY